MFSAIKAYFGHLLEVPDAVSPARYRSLRRIMTILMVTVSVTPLLILTGINHAQYMSTLEREMENPLYAMVRKSQASMELFLGERASTVSLIAHAYSFDDLTNEQTLNRVFLALKSEFQGFVDMGLVDVNGRQVAYVGPYKLKDADYAGQPWLSEAQVKGRYISDVFLGLRGFPHMVIAVHRMEESGREWTLRVTIDTSRLERLVAAVGLMQDTDAFLCDSRGVLQTNSRFYGKVLDKLPLTLPPSPSRPRCGPGRTTADRISWWPIPAWRARTSCSWPSSPPWTSTNPGRPCAASCCWSSAAASPSSCWSRTC